MNQNQKLLNKRNLSILLVSCVLSFLIGRFSLPTKVETKTKQVSKTETTNTDTSNNSNKIQKNERLKKTIREKRLPDGTVEKTTTYTKVDKSKTETESNLSKSSSTKSSEILTTSKTTVYSLGLSLGLMVGLDITALSSNPQRLYGAFVSKTLLGPISVGAFGFHTGVLGVSVGLQF